jgi:hypothetical protein
MPAQRLATKAEFETDDMSFCTERRIGTAGVRAGSAGARGAFCPAPGSEPNTCEISGAISLGLTV